MIEIKGTWKGKTKKIKEIRYLFDAIATEDEIFNFYDNFIEKPDDKIYMEMEKWYIKNKKYLKEIGEYIEIVRKNN